MDIRKISHAVGTAQIAVLDGEEVVKPVKAYKNHQFLNGPQAKTIRVMSEMMETETRMAGSGVNKTILFFGSARSKSPEEHAAAVAKWHAVLGDRTSEDSAKARATRELSRLEATKWMCEVYPAIQDLAQRLTSWSMSRIGPDGKMPYAVASGGGPGLMEAANRGAAAVPGALTLGCGISLPFEAGLNKYVTPELAFEYHYFFVRKFSMCYWCRAFVAAPGGYGTLDELMEVLTLLQTGKIDFAEHMPVVLFGSTFWKRIVNWQSLVELGVIAQSDVDRLFVTDSVQDAYEHITGKLLAWEKAAAKVAADSSVVSTADKSGLSSAAQAHLRIAADHASQAATMGYDATGSAAEDGHAHRASFLAPVPVPGDRTPGGTLDSTPPADTQLVSPAGTTSKASHGATTVASGLDL